MNPISRGIRNAFRNGVRTISVILILSLSIGLGLTMLVANKAVSNKIASVKSSIGTSITISPAGFSPGSQANNALTTDALKNVQSVAHVTMLTETLDDRLSTTGTSQPSFGFGGQNSGDSATTSLKSPVKINPDSKRSGGGGNFNVFVSGGGGLPANFSPPVSFLGTNDTSQVNGTSINIKSGKSIDASSNASEALVSTDMASKNNLKVGSKFQAYNSTLSVAGIFTSSNEGSNNTVVLPLQTEQRLSGQAGVVTGAVATVDSLDNLSGATNTIKNKLGSSADVISSQEQADDTVKPLNGVKTVSVFSLIGTVVAGAAIILLTMVMVVRERKREIGVVKAIGGSNVRIMAEFMVEALTLAMAGAIIGLVIGVVAGQPVTNALVDNSTGSSTGAVQGPGGRQVRINAGAGGPGRGFGGAFRNNSAVRGISNINAEIGWGILLEGFGAAVLIAVVGSALAAGMISKVRPSEILRSA